MKKLLITGASGFIGGFIVEKALALGYEVFAVVRSTSSRQYLKDPAINFIELNFKEVPQLTQQLKELKQEYGSFDYVIHNAGITKANRNADFYEVNTKITERFIDALISSDLVKSKFIFVSSLAAAGPGTASSSHFIQIDQEPHPVTTYGKSKLEAEKYLQSKSDFPYLILRPTAVFGPRDTELFALFSLVNKHLELYIGTDEQRLSFIYVKDLVSLLFKSMESEKVNKIYYLSDGKSYLIKDFIGEIKSVLNKKTLKFKVPVPLVAIIAVILEKVLGVFGKVPALNSEKMAELTCPNWVCDMTAYFNDFSIKPEYDLREALAETTAWYKKQNWING